MPAPASIEAFLELGLKSGLLEQPAVDDLRQSLSQSGPMPRTVEDLAKALVRDGLLTTFQANSLLAGKWRGFVINDKYRLLHRVGAGGMGCVYLCEHVHMRRRVALKVLPLTLAQDPDAVERFYREARAVACLDHPNIVRAHDIDHEGNLHFLVMEYIDGSNFHEIIRRHGPMAIVRAAHYIRQAAQGLQHAHEAGLVHRDVKPGNLLLDRNGVVKILDMGLARFFHEPEENLSFDQEVGNVLGTADYLAPEQVQDSRVDIRADIYSLGVTFYFLLSGKSPFAQGTVAQKLIWQQVRQPKPIRTLRPEVPEDLAKIIDTMIAKEPAERYLVPSAVVEALIPWTQTAIPPPPEAEMPPLGLAGAGAQCGTGSNNTPISRLGPATPVSRAPKMVVVRSAPAKVEPAPAPILADSVVIPPPLPAEASAPSPTASVFKDALPKPPAPVSQPVSPNAQAKPKLPTPPAIKQNSSAPAAIKIPDSGPPTPKMPAPVKPTIENKDEKGKNKTVAVSQAAVQSAADEVKPVAVTAPAKLPLPNRRPAAPAKAQQPSKQPAKAEAKPKPTRAKAKTNPVADPEATGISWTIPVVLALAGVAAALWWLLT